MVNSGDASIESLETIFYIILLPNLEGQIRAIIDHYSIISIVARDHESTTNPNNASLLLSGQEVVGFSFHYKNIFAKR